MLDKVGSDLTVTNTLAYCDTKLTTTVESFTAQERVITYFIVIKSQNLKKNLFIYFTNISIFVYIVFRRHDIRQNGTQLNDTLHNVAQQNKLFSGSDVIKLFTSIIY